MSTADRIDKFQTDCNLLLHNDNQSNNVMKIVSEVKKLSQWLQKHQSEVVPDNHKQILLTIIENYYNYYLQKRKDSTVLLDVVTLLVDDCLKLPEGKLINSKGKKRALKWIEILHSPTTSDGRVGSSSNTNRIDIHSTFSATTTTNPIYIVISIQEHNKSISVMDESSGESVIDNISISSSTQWRALKRHFAKPEVTDVYVHLSETEAILKLFIDGVEIS